MSSRLRSQAALTPTPKDAGWTQYQLRSFGEENALLSLQGMDPRSLVCPARSLVAIPSTQSRPLTCVMQQIDKTKRDRTNTSF